MITFFWMKPLCFLLSSPDEWDSLLCHYLLSKWETVPFGDCRVSVSFFHFFCYFFSDIFYTTRKSSFSGCVICRSSLRFTWTKSCYELPPASNRASLIHAPLGWSGGSWVGTMRRRGTVWCDGPKQITCIRCFWIWPLTRVARDPPSPICSVIVCILVTSHETLLSVSSNLRFARPEAQERMCF